MSPFAWAPGGAVVETAERSRRFALARRLVPAVGVAVTLLTAAAAAEAPPPGVGRTRRAMVASIKPPPVEVRRVREAAGEPPAIQARRTGEAVALDGRLDEPAWAGVPRFTRFVESFPQQGAAPTLRTEVRVLYDDERLYVGITCYDPDPSRVVQVLARRDSVPASDRVEVVLDSEAGGRTAYGFGMNAAGVLSDRLLFANVNSTQSWDATWDGVAALHGEGWTAELAIPLSALRFSDRPEQAWGILVRRHVSRTRQVFDSALIPRDANPVDPGGLVVSRFGRLEGLQRIEPRRATELVPTLTSRASLRPQYSAPDRAEPRMLVPELELGLGVRTMLTSDLHFTGALNPDFGQVEADTVVQNLLTQERYFPERRPFFTEGLEIFEPVGAEYGTPQQAFYSRRVGLDAPIFAAGKVSGSAAAGLDLAVLNAVVMGAANASLAPVAHSAPDPDLLAPYEQAPDHRWRFRWRRPFHLGPESALPRTRPVATNYFAAVSRQRLGAASALGATFTAATPLEARCGREEFPGEAEYLAAGCHALGGNALTLDGNVRDEQGVWGGFGQVSVSQQVGGDPAGWVLADGTRMAPGTLGYGGHLRVGKLGGEPFRFDVTYAFQDPRLDLNHLGFQPLSNYQWTDLNLHYVRPNGWGALHSVAVDYNFDINWSADGRWLPRGLNTNLYGRVQLPSYDAVGLRLGLESPQFDTREIHGAGVGFERLPLVFVAVDLQTDPNRPLIVSADAEVGRMLGQGAARSRTAYKGNAGVTWRPSDRLETRLEAGYAWDPQGPRWLENAGDTARFGEQFPESLSVTLRQQLVLSPRLTAQVYAQVFRSNVRYGALYQAPLDGLERLPVSMLAPSEGFTAPGENDAVVNLNAVLRWEYRIGSPVFLVYSRSQGAWGAAEGPPWRSGLLPSRLSMGGAAEMLMLKWSFWWSDHG